MISKRQHIIAEACGWEYRQCNNPTSSYHAWIKDGEWHEVGPPDYLNDLNAMHEAEKFLTDDQWHFYFDSLVTDIAGSVSAPNHLLYPRIVHATASQRAEAFLQTIGKWVK